MIGSRLTMAGSKAEVEVNLSTLRSLDDFILGSSRFQNPKNKLKWAKRVLRNLIYYQTNYILSAAILFLIALFIHPVKMVGGIMAMVLIVGLVMLEQVHLPRENQTIAAVVSTLVITSYAFSSIVLVITEVFLIMLAVLLHASFRKRNLRNKIAIKMEKWGLNPDTLMGRLLRFLGIDIGKL